MAELRMVEFTELEKILDALRAAKKFLKLRDEMNAEVHLARDVRYSPLTTEVEACCDRVRRLMEPPAGAPLPDRPDKD